MNKNILARISKTSALLGLVLSLLACAQPSPVNLGIADAVPALAIDSVKVSATGETVAFKTSLANGELYLLKASGAVGAGANTVDAEFGGFGAGAAGADVVGGVDVGLDVGRPALRGASGRMKWFGGYRPDHVYYMLVTGEGKPLTLKLITSGTTPAASGALTVALIRLSPAPPALAKPLETLAVPVLETKTSTTMAPAQSSIYLLQCAGQGKVGGGGLGMGDAEYMDYRADGTGKEDIGDGNTDYGLGVDEADLSKSPRKNWWGPWRQDHIYYLLYTGTGNPITFMYYDVKGGYGDNSKTDKLTVSVFAAP